MNQTFLVPANSKKQNLIFGFLLPVDLIILCVGIGISFILLISLPIAEIWALVIALIPLCVAATLVFPVAHYHNTRILIQEIFRFYKNRRRYIWRGWCYTYEQSNDKR